MEKTVLGVDVPSGRSEFSVSADGKRTYFPAGSAYYVFDERGDLLSRMPTNTVARSLALLPGGRFISAQTHAGGHIALMGADGSELRTLVQRGAAPEHLHSDATGWTSPTGIAFDAAHQLLFALDTTLAPAGVPDPDWSRIVVYDAAGKYLRQIAAYDGKQDPASNPGRTWYDDVEIDSKRSVLYLTARASKQLLAFGYDGKPLGQVPGVTGIAVFPNGNVAVGDPGNAGVRIYDSALRLLKTLAAPQVLDLEVDAAGRLYASTADPLVLYLRWPPTLSELAVVRPNFRHIAVTFPVDSAIAGAPLALRVAVTGRPLPAADSWHAFMRPGDGSDLTWRELDSSYADGNLQVQTSATQLGLNQLAVRYGAGWMSRAEGTRDLSVSKLLRLTPASKTGSVSVQSALGRTGFQSGEAIQMRIDARGATPLSFATLSLQRAGQTLASAPVSLAQSYWELPPALTRRLPAGRYTVSAEAAGLQTTPYQFDLAQAEPSSPMQRILYHEFGESLESLPWSNVRDAPEQLAAIRDYVDSLVSLGFTRETDRSATKLTSYKAAGAWRSDSMSEPAAHDGIPEGGLWQPEAYLDRATGAGVHYDTQLLSHCSGVRLADSWFPPLNGTLQRLSQWFGKYPSFYGFNYNDEAFFPGFSWVDSIPADKAWLEAASAQLPGRPRADVLRAGLAHMYSEFDQAVKQVRPDLSRTATPMWQYPAVEGSYPPSIYAHMTESYSHYLSEGYSWPWYPAHSADVLRRPGLPLMAVFDNGYAIRDGESYLKDALQVLGRGVQGFGVEHTRPLKDATGANALRVMNSLGEAYGPIFAEVPPDNEATVLYSYTQDVTEKRDLLGTPHWERVQALYGAGLMAGLPMSIAYEEDVAAGSLLEHGKPKTGLLFLVGQTAELPSAVRSALDRFRAAGGKIVIDADSREFPGAIRFPQSVFGLSDAARAAFDGDGLFPDLQPLFETIAGALSRQFGAGRRFAVDTDEPWVSKNRFDGGAIRYVLIASETSPYPWDAPSTWSVGGRFNRTYWPKSVALSVPRSSVIYDVFDRSVLAPTVNGTRSVVQADLRTFPGKLYALAPRELEAPKLIARVDEDNLSYSVNVGIQARVPLRIVLGDGHGARSTLFRSTNLRGEFEQVAARPIGAGPWTLEVTELLGGKSSSVSLPAGAFPQPWVQLAPDVEVEREPQIRALLQQAPHSVHVVGVLDTLPAALRASLLQALKAAGSNVTFEPVPAKPGPGTYLVLENNPSKSLNELVKTANLAGLFGRKLTDASPGPGRGLLSAVFAARLYGENCLTIVGGDQRGLNAATERFIALLNGAPHRPAPATARKQSQATGAQAALVGAPSARASIPTLSERTGIRLSGIRASHGKLALTANGYLANLARVDDDGQRGRLVTVARVGESPLTSSLFVSNDGSAYGVAARTVKRFGEAFSLSNTGSASSDFFTSFGDAPPFQHAFSVSGDANTVLAPGPFGVVAWQRKANHWQEAWSVDYWKQFDSLDWPVSGNDARIPSFDTLIPKNGSLGLIAFAELTNNQWLAAGAVSSAEVSARSLKDGSSLWRLKVPVTGTLLLPKLYSNSGGSLVLLQAQLGATGALRYYAIEQGKVAGTWGSDDAPLSSDISERTRRIVTAYGNGSRLLEVRNADGTVVFGRTWHSQPIAVAFAEDGASVFVSDDAGVLSRLDAHGELTWQVSLGCSVELAEDDGQLYAAGWDGRLRAFTADGHQRWSLDLTEPMKGLSAAHSAEPSLVHEPHRTSSASALVPRGSNLLRSGQATLTVGGTRGWKSPGKVLVEASALTNGVVDDVVSPWIARDELFWDGVASRKVWAEVNFKQPTDVHSLTVYENPTFPEAWPTESVVQVWDEPGQRWRTAKHGVFLHGAVATYSLDLKRVTKLRYVPWSNYFQNFHTSEIEVR